MEGSASVEKLEKSTNCQNCALCINCLQIFENTRRCPGCNNLVEKEAKLKFSIVSNCENLKQDYLSFKSNCETFFLDVVSTLCLNDSVLPEIEVIELLIEQIMPKQSKNNEDELVFSLNPTIKSTLLQLLLKYGSSEVEKVLENLFSKSATFLKDAYNYKDVMELNLMYIHAIEDSLYSTATDKLKNTNIYSDAELAIELLKKLTRSVNSQDIEKFNQISQLRTIAEIRFCFVTCSKFIIEYDSNNRTQKALMNQANSFIETYKSEWPKYFILKQVFRRYGKTALTSTNKFQELKWIIPDYLANNLTDVSFLVDFIVHFIFQ